MLMKPELARLVLTGRKTQTRRLAHGNTFYRAGRSYPLERLARRAEMSDVERVRMDRPNPRRRGRPPRVAIGRLDILDVRLEALGTIGYDDARAEGFRTPADFRRYWLGLHDRAWPAVEQVPCPACLADPDFPADELPPCVMCAGEADIPIRPWPTDDEVLERFDARHAHRDVWVITFKLSQEHEPRFLAEHSELGYVPTEYNERGRRVALTGEPEALSDADFAKHVDTPQQREKEAQRAAAAARARELDRELRTAEDRIINARRAASLNGINISGELALARKHRAAGDQAGQLRAIRAAERIADAGPRRNDRLRAA